MYDKNGKLTRAGAEEVIRSGRAVMIGNRIITQIENLPSDAEFAKGDANAEAAARTKLEQEIADKRAQLASLGAAATPPAALIEDAGETATHARTTRRRSHE